MVASIESMKKFKVPVTVKEFATHFKDKGFLIYIVGGAIRDSLLKNGNNDFDFATDAKPTDVLKMFKTVIPTGIKHGTVTVLYKNHSFEVTTFRSDGIYSNFRHPKNVEFVISLEEDLKRRDFTINALAVDPFEGRIIDYHQGLKDLKEKKIRAIGDPNKRFEEDALRILRGCRFASQLQFEIEEKTLLAMNKLSTNLKEISNERIRDEFLKIIASEKPSVGLLAMLNCKALNIVLPELVDSIGVIQNELHQSDVFNHSISACDFVPKEKVLVRIAALFHDIGKPRVKNITDDKRITFYRHEKESALITGNVLERLKFPNIQIKTIVNLVENHMFNFTQEWTDGSIRRFINRVGLDAIDDLFLLRRADRYAINGSTNYEDLLFFKKRIEEVLKSSNALSLKDLKINGELLNKAGIPKGPVMGIVLQNLLDAVLDDPLLNEEVKLKEIALKFYESRINL